MRSTSISAATCSNCRSAPPPSTADFVFSWALGSWGSLLGRRRGIAGNKAVDVNSRTSSRVEGELARAAQALRRAAASAEGAGATSVQLDLENLVVEVLRVFYSLTGSRPVSAGSSRIPGQMSLYSSEDKPR